MKIEDLIELTAYLTIDRIGDARGLDSDDLADLVSETAAIVSLAAWEWECDADDADADADDDADADADADDVLCPDVESWMRVHDREPYSTRSGTYWWDSPESILTCGREKLPADVWDEMGYASTTSDYFSREAAVAALREALLALKLIAQ